MFDDESFDCLVSAEVLEHVPSPYNTLREYNRVLKDSGTLIITTPNSHYLARVIYPFSWTKYEIVARHINSFDLTQWNVLFHLTGFEMNWWNGFGGYAFPNWKGLGRILDKLIDKKRVSQYIIVKGNKKSRESLDDPTL